MILIYNAPYYKSAVMAVNTVAQTLTAGGVIEYSTNNLLTGCSISRTAGSSDVILTRAGLYSVSFNADFIPSAAGNVTFQLVSNGTAVQGAEATVTAAADSTSNVSFTALVRVMPNCPAIDNTTTLQVTASAAATVSNAAITVIKQA